MVRGSDTSYTFLCLLLLWQCVVYSISGDIKLRVATFLGLTVPSETSTIADIWKHLQMQHKVLVCNTYALWRFRCQRLPAPALISPLIDYVPRWLALLRLVVWIARRCQIVSSFVPGGCCVALQMLMRVGVLSWIKPGEKFRSSLGSVVTIYSTKKWINNCFALESCGKPGHFARVSVEHRI